MSFVSTVGRGPVPLRMARAAATGEDKGRPPDDPPRREKDHAAEDLATEPEAVRDADAASGGAARPAGPSTAAARAEALRFEMRAEVADADQARRRAEASLERLRTAQMVRAVQDAGRISGIKPRAPALSGEILGPEDLGGDDAQIIDISPDRAMSP